MEEASSFVFAFFSVVPAVFQLGVCVYYFRNRQAADSAFLLIGGIIHLIVSVAVTVVMPSFVRSQMMSGEMSAAQMAYVYSVLNLIGFVGMVCSITGLFLLVRRTVQKDKKISDGFEEY